MTDDPLAFLLTWTCYGTWLPGDERGWLEKGETAIRPGDSFRASVAQRKMAESRVTLNLEQRRTVAGSMRGHAEFRSWELFALNVRTNHVHVVVGFAGTKPSVVIQQFKSYATRSLREQSPERTRWWTKGGSKRFINDEEHLAAAIRYVKERQ
ncbi:MAG: transposase [Planctomycetota bacterium]